MVLDRIIRVEQESRTRKHYEDLKAQLLKISRDASSFSFYRSFLLNACDVLAKKEENRVQFTEKLQVFFQRKFSARPSLYLFDASGKLEKSSKLNQPNKYIINLCWNALTDEAFFEKNENSLRKKLQILFGSECSLGFLKIREGRLISFRKKGENGYFFWKRIAKDSRAGLLFFHFNPVDTVQILESFHQNADIGISYWYPLKSDPSFSTGHSKQDGFVAKKTLENQVSNLFEFKKKLWFAVKTDEGTFIGSKASLSDKEFMKKWGLKNLLFVLSVSILILFGFLPGLSLQRLYISISTKLFALVVISVAIPIFGFAYTGLILIEEHEQFLLAKIENEQRRFLSAIENEFVVDEQNFVDECNLIFEQIIENFSLDKFARLAKELLKNNRAIHLEVRSIKGEVLASYNKIGYLAGLEGTLDALSRYGIEYQLEDRLENEKIEQKKSSDEVLKQFWAMTDSGFWQLLEAPGKVHKIKFTHSDLFFYWRFVRISQHQLGLVTIMQAREQSLKNFLKNYIKRNRADTLQLGFFNKDTCGWLKPPSRLIKEAEELTQQALAEKNTMTRVLQDPSGKYIVISMPGILIEPYCIIFIKSFESIARAVSLLKMQLFFGIFFVFLATLLVAKIISQYILGPIKEIDHCLDSMQSHGIEKKAEISAHDELGELGEAFNRMIDDLEEVRLAQIVQKSLFPRKESSIPGYDTSLFNCTAAELGGDYCDFFPIDESQWLILIGDVSGHGAPAALAMAMVKAAVFRACREKVDFDEIPNLISSMMIKVLKRKKMMTMLFVKLDTKLHRLSFLNAGHLWPIILRNKGVTQELKVVGMPLGVTRNTFQRKSVSVDLEEGDGFLAFTDALVEGVNQQEEPFGFDRLYHLVNNSCHFMPEKVIANLHEAWREHLGNGKQEDDFTMLCLKRRKQGRK